MTPCAFVVGASFFAASAHRARFASQPTLLFGLAEFSLFVAAPRGEAELLLGVAALVLGAATLVRGAMAAVVRGALRLVVGAAALVFGGSSNVQYAYNTVQCVLYNTNWSFIWNAGTLDAFPTTYS